MNLQAIAIAIVVSFLAGAASGWKYENGRFVEFKKDVAVVAAQQEAKVESITKQQALVTKGIKDEYDAKLNAVRTYYKSTSVWNNASGNKVSGVSTTPSVSDVITAYNVLAGQCAETTLQLTQLQKWLNEQIGIK